VDKEYLSSVTSPVTLDGIEDLYRSHFAALMRVANLMSDSAAAAEDAVHDVFVRCAHESARLSTRQAICGRRLSMSAVRSIGNGDATIRHSGQSSLMTFHMSYSKRGLLSVGSPRANGR